MSEPPAANGEAPELGNPAEELEYRLRQQQLTTDYALFALTTYDVQSLLQEATRICAQGLQSQLCKLMEYMPDEHKFLVRAGVGWKPGVVGHARVGADTASPAGYAFKTGEAVISNHLENETRFRTPGILVEYGIKRAINAPILCRSERFGVLEVDSSVEGRFTDADLVFVKGFANLLGVALERQRVVAELQHQEALLKKSLAHQKVLAMEIGHRVKNSLSIIAGLLNMQARSSQDSRLQEALSVAQSRVQAIATVHDRLWRGDQVRAVNVAEFLGMLCEDLHASAPEHELVCEIEPVRVAADQAISLGLLTNELVTNALKYAYPDSPGKVSIVVRRVEPGRLRFEVTDRGVGLPDDFTSKGGLGGKVIESLSHHLSGEIEWQDAQPGTRFVLTFQPEVPPEDDEDTA